MLTQMMKRFLLFSFCLCILLCTEAKIQPAPLFNNGMVLQQKEKVKIWGWAVPETRITLQASWNSKQQTTVSDKTGRWQFFVQTPKASFKTWKLHLSDGEPLVISDVLIGEVWFASGQSNMSMPLQGWEGCPVANSSRYIQTADKYSGHLRFAQQTYLPAAKPSSAATTPWTDCTGETAADFSAVGFFFGSILTETLHCPVGIIHSSCGSSRVESWTPKDLVDSYSNIEGKTDNAKDFNPMTPSVLYNGMICPFSGYTLKGFIWYQGEANVENYSEYATRLGNMITRWRQDWGNEELPFLSVEITPCLYFGRAKGRAPRLREAQWKVTHAIPRAAMICTNDLVSPEEKRQIHPSRKYEVGQRLAWLALNKVYKQPTAKAHYSEFQKAKFSGNKVLLSFSNTDKGFLPNDSIIGFEVCGNDNVYFPATATIIGNKIEVGAPNVIPKKVRYAFGDFFLANLRNGHGLPVVPFRSTF